MWTESGVHEVVVSSVDGGIREEERSLEDSAIESLTGIPHLSGIIDGKIPWIDLTEVSWIWLFGHVLPTCKQIHSSPPMSDVLCVLLTGAD